MSKRYAITLKDDVAKNLEEYADRIGIAPSTYIAFVVGQNLETFNRVIGGVTDAFGQSIDLLDGDTVPR